MREEMHFIRCICDICGKSFDVKKEEKSPLKELCLPMTYFSETGKVLDITTAKIDVCDDCLVQMKDDLCEHYEMSVVAWGGTNIKRKGGTEQ